MRKLTPLSRRRFGQGLGASLALAGLPCPARAHDGPHEVEVRISGFTFQPDRVTIRTGDTVVWINTDLAPHTATAREGGWETGAIETGEQARVVFETPGDFDYFCAYHPHMTGSVSVRPKQSG
ncbi:MAG: cupredoxin family copper-binding protein [Silicimonas sp.]|nr:cupredoxin family copper-binding protein [Silicimonas sp.]